MKIALVVPGGVDRSGEYRVIPALLALIRHLASNHEVHVFALFQQPEPDTWSLEGATVQNIGRKRIVWRTFNAIRDEHRSGSFDVLQSIWSGNSGLLAIACARLLGIPSLLHVAGGELVSLPDIAYGGRRSWPGRVREAIVLRTAGTVTAASSPMIGMLDQLGIAAQRVPLGVDLDVWQPCAPQRRDPGSVLRLIHVASLNRVKDQTTLLLALAKVAQQSQQIRLDVFGADTLAGSIQALSAELGISNLVRFHGFLRYSELHSHVAAAHLLLMSSRHEAGPLSVLEAAVCGVPTIGTRVGHIAEWAPDAALAVPVCDSDALAEAILTLGHDEDRRLTIARQASIHAIRENASYSAHLFEQLFEQACGRDRKERR